MLKNLFSWIKNNKVTTGLIILVAFILFKPTRSYKTSYMMDSVGSSTGFGNMMESSLADDAYYSTKSAPTNSARKVIVNTNFSLLVKSVETVSNNIKAKTTELGGFVVTSYTNRTQYGEKATITVRVPSDKLNEYSTFLKESSVKVVSENIQGRDITDQYIDLQDRINRLEATQARFEEIMEEATEVTEILQVQKEIFNLQDRIDAYKGQLQYMEKASDTSSVTITLSTDELGLPYTPIKSWNPEIVFKQAVRSMLGTLQDVGTAGIWFVVYVPLIGLGLLAIIVAKKVIKKLKTKKTTKKKEK